MTRSIKKGPFVDAHLQKKVDEQNEKGTRVRFFAGEGFGAEFFDGTPTMVVTKGAVTDDPEFDEAVADAAEAEKEVQELEQAAALEAEAESQAAAE